MCLCHPACPSVYLSYTYVYAIQLAPLFTFLINMSMPPSLPHCLPVYAIQLAPLFTFVYMCLCHLAYPTVYLSYICVYAIQLAPLFTFLINMSMPSSLPHLFTYFIKMSMPSSLPRSLPFIYMCLCHPACPTVYLWHMCLCH